MARSRSARILVVALAAFPAACAVEAPPFPGFPDESEASADLDTPAPDSTPPADVPDPGGDAAAPDVPAGRDVPAILDNPDEGTVPIDTPCVPACLGRTCGDDGCGGSCGPCESPRLCNTAGQCLDDPGNPGTCQGAHGTVGCCSPDGSAVYHWDGTQVRVDGCPGVLPCGWDPSSMAYQCTGGGSDPGGRFPYGCGGQNPFCDLASCGNDDGCGLPCGCAPGYACHPTLLTCQFADWTGTYQGPYSIRGRVTQLPFGSSTPVTCDGTLALVVQVGASPGIRGDTACSVAVSPVVAEVRMVFTGEVKDLALAVGSVQFLVDGNPVGETGFEAQFSGPGPRALRGQVTGGTSYENGFVRIELVGASWDLVESP